MGTGKMYFFNGAVFLVLFHAAFNVPGKDIELYYLYSLISNLGHKSNEYHFIYWNNSLHLKPLYSDMI